MHESFEEAGKRLVVGANALDSNAAPCASTKRHVPFSQVLAFFSKPAIGIKRLGVGEMSRVSVYEADADRDNGLGMDFMSAGQRLELLDRIFATHPAR